MLVNTQSGAVSMENSTAAPQEISSKINGMIQKFHLWVWKNWEQGREDLSTHVHGSIIHNSQKLEAPQLFIKRWMNKQNIVYPYNEILYNLKKGTNSDTCYNKGEPWRTLY